MNASLSKRLNGLLSASIAVGGAVAVAFSFALSFHDANELQDAQLQQVAALLAAEPMIAASTDFKPRSSEDAEVHYVVKLLGEDGPVRHPAYDVALSASLANGLQDVAQDSVRWRVMVGQTHTGQRFGVAQRMTVRDEVARNGAIFTAIPLLALVPVLLAIVALTVRRTFAPLKQMSADVDALDGGRLSNLDEQRAPGEVLPLVQAVNRLMDRLALALEQQRRFVSDAAHELRTPVATLMVQADNVMHIDLPPEAARRMAILRQGLKRASALLDQLLKYARIQGTAPPMAQRLDLSEYVRAAIEANLPLAQAKGVDLGCIRIDHTTVMGDPLHAQALVRNAIDNAVRYTPYGGSVDVSVTTDYDVATFVVEDTGPGIAQCDLDRVFQPFVRVLGSEESGSGLGLAIVRTAARTLGGAVILGPRSDGRGGLRFTYTQPTA